MQFEFLRKSNLVKLLMLLALTLMVLVSAGGCGGSSHHSKSKSNSDTNNEIDDDDDTDDNDSDTDTDTNTDDDNSGSTDATFSVGADGTYYIVLGSSSSTKSKSSYSPVNSAAASSIPVYDYVWHATPDVSQDYYTNGTSGTVKLTEDDVEDLIEDDNNSVYRNYGVYINRDVHYLSNTLTFDSSTTVKKDNDEEYPCYYDDAVVTEAKAAYPSVNYSNNKIIFATLPKQNGSTFAQTRSALTFSAAEAYKNPVLHITKAGTYNISGTWQGQIWVDVGDDADDKVKLILNNANITCTVAPALVFYETYEGAEDANDTYTDEDNMTTAYALEMDSHVTASTAGSVLELASGTTNTITGKNLYRILSIAPKSGATVIDGATISYQKKRWKIDGALNSMQSLEIHGTGTLNVNGSYEGLDSEMHLIINNGNINVTASDDGINTNEDNVSVCLVNAGTLTVTSSVGDGIDSNGWIVINGGTVTATAASGGSENGLDADKGVYVKTGVTVTANNVNAQKTDVTGYAGTITGATSGNTGPGGTPPSQAPDNPPTKDGPGGEAPNIQ